MKRILVLVVSAMLLVGGSCSVVALFRSLEWQRGQAAAERDWKARHVVLYAGGQSRFASTAEHFFAHSYDHYFDHSYDREAGLLIRLIGVRPELYTLAISEKRGSGSTRVGVRPELTTSGWRVQSETFTLKVYGSGLTLLKLLDAWGEEEFRGLMQKDRAGLEGIHQATGECEMPKVSCQAHELCQSRRKNRPIDQRYVRFASLIQ